ncbi:hypothetical protein [Phenylobacterium sp.]|uniref:hypothetical protein n=1 Tax=Phenylobacterium sp. TaxID=1871053 RepID=UPI0028125EF6|nr:hypothetical protein [Phenylobacterium sp.]
MTGAAASGAQALGPIGPASRIVIVGCAGSGKSRLASELGRRLRLRVIHADREFWQPGWRDPDNDAYRARIAQMTAAGGWIFDGVPGRVPDIVLPRAEAVIWLEQPAWLCAARAYLRTLTYLGRTRPDMAEGCPERLSLRLLDYARTFDAVLRPRLEDWLSRYAAGAQLLRLHGDRQVAAFLRSLPEARG